MPIGTRLGLLYSWKSKMIINSRSQSLPHLRREQAYNYKHIVVIIGAGSLNDNLLLRGQYDSLLQ